MMYILNKVDYRIWYNKTMKNLSSNKGFTLVEMLVVIAIIGILSASVLVALGPSRDKARDARIISAVAQVRSLMEVYFNPSDSTYNITILITKPEFTAVLKEVTDNQATSVNLTNRGLKITPTTGTPKIFSVSAQLNSGKWWCSDSTGFSGQTNAIGADTCILQTP